MGLASRRDVILSAAAAALVGDMGVARAQAWPAKPIKIVVPFPAGGSVDSFGRVFAAQLQERLKQPVVIDNRGGAGGNVGANMVAKSPADGYTLLLHTNGQAISPAIYKSLPFDPVADFARVAELAITSTVIVVNNKMPIKTFQEFVAYAKANPGKVSYAYGNSTGQITGEAMAKRLGLDMARVAYRSNPEALTALIGGQVSIMALDFSNALPQLATKSVRPLAVLTKARSATMPDVPTLDETIMPDYDLLAWAGVFGPAAMPPEVTRKLSAALDSSLNDPDVKARFDKFGIEIFYTGPAAFADYVKTELVKWTALIKEAGIQPE